MGRAKIGAIIALDGEKEFKQAVTGCNRELTKLKSESALVEEQFSGQANTLEALKEKHKVLTKVLEAHKKKEQDLENGKRHAEETLQSYGQKLESLKSDYNAAVEEMERMKQASTSTAQELAEQQKEVERLAAGLRGSERNYQTAAARVNDWETKLNAARVQTIRANRELEQNDRYMEEAEHSTDRMTHSIDEYGNQVRESTEVTVGWGTALKAAVSGKIVDGVVDLAKAIGDASIGAANDMTVAANQVQVSTGTTTEEMEKYKESMEDIYQNNYGDNFDDIADAVSAIAQNFKDMDPSTLQETAESAITMRDVFDFDYQEQIRAVKMLMDSFGISSENAYNLIAQGAQNGLNKNGDLLDTINEYSVHYKQMGVTAEGFFNSLINGTEAGTFSVDKLGDAYKEFGIKVKDTATTTDEAYQLLGMNADEMRAKFAAGGESARVATSEVLTMLFHMDDQVKQNQAGVDLFGTMWEDLGIEGVKALTNLNGEISVTKNAMEDIKNVKYSDAANQITQLSRTIQMKIAVPLANKLLPEINKGLEAVGDNLEAVTTAAVGFGTAIALYKFSKTDVYASLAKTLKNVKVAMTAATAATAQNAIKTKLAAGAQTLLNAAQNMSPIGILITGIGLLTAGMAAYQIATKDTVDETKELNESLQNQRDAIQQNLEEYKENIVNIESQWSANKLLVDKLYELNDIEGKTSAQKSVMKGIVEELSEELPELAAGFDAETGSMRLTKEAVTDLIQKKKEYATVMAAQNSLQDLAKQVSDADIAIAKAEQNLEEYFLKLKEVGADISEEARNDVEGLTKALSYMGGDYLLEYKNLNAAIEEGKEIRDEANKSLEIATKRLEEYEGTAASAAQGTEDMAASEEVAADAGKKMADTQAEAFTQMEEAISGSIKSSISLFDEFSGGAEISAQKIAENLDSQINGLTNWADNMETLAGAAGEGMTEEFYAYLAEMGPQSANLVQALVDSLEGNSGKFTEICQKWTQAMDLETPLTEQTTKAYQTMVEQIENQKRPLLDAINNLYEESRTANETSMAAWTQKNMEVSKKAGLDQTKAEAVGITAGKGDIDRANQTIKEGIESQLNTLPPVAQNIGSNIPLGMAQGINQNAQAAVAAAQNMAAAVQNASRNTLQIHSPSKTFMQDGKFITQGLAIGIRSARAEAESSIRNVCGAVLQAAQTDLDIHSPSKKFKEKVGEQISRGVAFGIAAKRGEAIKNSKSLAQDVYKAATSWLTDYKKTHATTLDDEKYFWNKIAATTKKRNYSL